MEQRSHSYNMKALLNSVPHWKLIEEYLAAETQRLVQMLHTCNEKDLKMIQGELKALTAISRLPSQLKTEQNTKR